jgi:hypothetical protein
MAVVSTNSWPYLVDPATLETSGGRRRALIQIVHLFRRLEARPSPRPETTAGLCRAINDSGRQISRSCWEVMPSREATGNDRVLGVMTNAELGITGMTMLTRLLASGARPKFSSEGLGRSPILS